MKDFPTDYHLRWFDRVMKGKATSGAADDPAVRLFVMGTGRRRTRTRMGACSTAATGRRRPRGPLPDLQATPFYLQRGGGLSQTAPIGAEPPTTYTYDPQHPVPTIWRVVLADSGLDSGGRLRPTRARVRRATRRRASWDRSAPYPALKARPDVLVFQTGAARGRHGGDRPGGRGALRRVERGRHRLHREDR